MTVSAATHPAHVLALDLPPGQGLRIAPEAFFCCDAAIQVRKQWRRGMMARLGHLLSGQQVFESIAVNAGTDALPLQLYWGAHGHTLRVSEGTPILWNKHAFVAASLSLGSFPFVNKRLPYQDFCAEKSKGSGTLYLKSESPVTRHILPEGASCLIAPQSWLASSFPMRFALRRSFPTRSLLQVWGPSTLYLSASWGTPLAPHRWVRASGGKGRVP